MQTAGLKTGLKLFAILIRMLNFQDGFNLRICFLDFL
jgi:hypothetical protein